MSLKAFNKKKYTVNVVYIANIEKYKVLPLLVVITDFLKCLCVRVRVKVGFVGCFFKLERRCTVQFYCPQCALELVHKFLWY